MTRKNNPDLVANTKPMASDDPPEAERLPIDVSAYDQETLTAMKPALGLAEKLLWHWKTFPIVLPDPIEHKIDPASGQTSTMRKKTVTRQELFCAPNFNELKAIAVDSRGQRRLLSHEQLDSVRRTGEFEVDSVEFPNQKHRWIINQLLIKGYEKSSETFLNDMAKALYLLVVVARDRIFGHDFSLRSSARNLLSGVERTFDCTIGLPQLYNPGLEVKLHNERSRYLVAELQCPDKKRLNRFGSHVEELLVVLMKNPKAEVSSLEAPPFCFQTLQGLEVDLRLCDNHVILKTKQCLVKILEANLKSGWIPEFRKETIAHLRSRQTAESEIREKTEQLLAEEYLERVCKAILSDPGMSGQVGSDVCRLLVDQLRTSVIVQQVLKEAKKSMEEHKKRVEDDLGLKHPLLSRLGPWVLRRLAEAEERYRKQRMWKGHEDAMARCKAAGLLQSSYFLARDLSFMRDREPMLRDELQAIKEPVKEFRFETRMWRPRNWVVTRVPASGGPAEVIETVIDDTTPTDSVSSEVPDPDNFYRVRKHAVKTTSTRFLFWRINNFFHRTVSWLWNAVYLLGFVVPFASSASFRALLAPEAFFPDYEVNQSNGTLEKRDWTKVHTVLSRVRALWRHILERRAEFNSSEDTGLLSKSIVNYFNIFVNYILKGVVGTVLVAFVLPPLMLATSAFSLALALATPVCIWPISAAFHLFSALFFDWEGQSPWNAVVWSVFVKIIGLGIVQPVLVLVVIVFCPIVASVISLGGLLRKGLRDVWDSTVFCTVLRKRARIPLKSGMLAKRIAGPGMAGEYFYQIKTEQALVALETAMEMDQLSSYWGATVRQIEQPIADYEKFVARMFGPFGVCPSHADKLSSNPCKILSSESESLKRKLNEILGRRQDTLAQRLPFDIKHLIRLNEADLKIVLNEGTRMVQSFYPQSVLGRMSPSDRKDFWYERDLTPNDWICLASALLTETFTREFLTPLQGEDISFLLKVKHWNLNRYLTMALESKWRDDLEVAQLIQSPKHNLAANPKIKIDWFDPMSYQPPMYDSSLRRTLATRTFQLKLSSSSAEADGPKQPALSAKLPIPHPVEISALIFNRDHPAGLDHFVNMDCERFQRVLGIFRRRSRASLPKNSDPSRSASSSVSTQPRSNSSSSSPETDHRAEMEKAMACLSESVNELDRDATKARPNRRKLSREAVMQRDLENAEAVHAAVMSVQSNLQRRPKLSLNHLNSYQQNFGIGLGIKEPGSIPLLSKGGDDDDDQDSPAPPGRASSQILPPTARSYEYNPNWNAGSRRQFGTAASKSRSDNRFTNLDLEERALMRESSDEKKEEKTHSSV